jgi:uncharacterized protein
MSREITPGARLNRLAGESSPYLLQHRANPVDWWPWGPEAFAEARRRDVPIFLSVGYSTCYWCHVMERESFEREEIATIMNGLYVNVKVDREERPDVDDLYMASVQAFSGRGGWPMSVFLEPDGLRPFYAGTYFPATAKYAGMPSFPQVLEGLAGAYRERRAEVLEQAETLADAVRERVVAAFEPTRVGERHVADAAMQLLKIHDRVRGGFGGAPKFPQPVYLDLLLAVRGAGDEETRAAVDAALRRTLDAMALGGMNDQVGGGFHRYTVDDKWLVPHFEKMLYDQAQLASVYARAAAVYDDAFFARVAAKTIEYVLREMTGPDGLFFSAQDAEVNQREGQNYLWTPEEVRATLPGEDGAFAVRLYGLHAGPNFRDPHHPDEPASNVLFLAERPADWARIDRVNAALYDVRARRDQPGLDDKSLASWNGMMIGSLAVCGRVLNRPDFLRAGERAAEALLRRMRTPDGGLLRSLREGRGSIPAVFEDYAFVAAGLMELHAAGGGTDGPFLRASEEIVAAAEARFADPVSGGYFDTLAGRSDLFVRARSVYDGAVPSGVGVMIHALIDLFRATGQDRSAQRAAAALRSVSGFISRSPLGASNSTRALLRMLSTARAAFDNAFAGLDAPERRAHDDPDFTPVEVLSAVREVTLGKDEPVSILLKVRIAEGYHVNAAAPGAAAEADGLTPFRVSVVGGGGVSVYADYPAGASFHADPDLLVYSGEFEFPIVLERTGDWKGRPMIAVTYQACTDEACLVPRTVELDIEIDRP